jgi:hypothetical protein
MVRDDLQMPSTAQVLLPVRVVEGDRLTEAINHDEIATHSSPSVAEVVVALRGMDKPRFMLWICRGSGWTERGSTYDPLRQHPAALLHEPAGEDDGVDLEEGGDPR